METIGNGCIHGEDEDRYPERPSAARRHGVLSSPTWHSDSGCVQSLGGGWWMLWSGRRGKKGWSQCTNKNLHQCITQGVQGSIGEIWLPADDQG